MPNDTLPRAVSVLTTLGDHGRESARRFLGRCTPDEAVDIADCECSEEFTAVIERILDRMESNG